MGGAYKNYGINISGTFGAAADGRINITSALNGKKAKDYFTIGDRVFVSYSGTGQQFHVRDVEDGGSNQYLYLMDNAGDLFGNMAPYNIASVSAIKVIESGYRNQQDYDAGGIVSKEFSVLKYNPADGTTGASFKSTPTSYSVNVNNKILNASAVEFTDVANMYCVANCTEESSQPYNPYRWKTLGVWKPFKSYVYITERNQNGSFAPTSPSLGNPVNTRTDGTFYAFDYFNWGGTNSNWTLANTITKFSNFGFTIEEKDALGVYNTSLYGYGLTLKTAIAFNAEAKEIVFKSFEDDNIVIPGDLCNNFWEHWSKVQSNSLSTTEAHTGSYSLVIPSVSTYTFSNSVGRTNCDNYNNDYSKAGVGPFPKTAFTVPTCACLGKFTPVKDCVYVVSGWGKIPQASGYNDYKDYSNLKLHVKFTDVNGNPAGTTTINASGSHIEGWQRYYGKFTVPSNAVSMKVEIQNLGTPAAYFDDLRIHPYEAMMESYVYDPITYKLVATLDADNYSTQFGYDAQGTTTNVKQETAKGLHTVSESRIHIKKQ